MNNRSIIIGAGTHGQIYASYLTEAGIEVVGFIDDNPSLYGKKVMGIPIIGKFENLKENSFKKTVQNVYCPIGDNIIREKYLTESKELGYSTPSFIHRTACIGPDVQMGEANYVLAGSTIMPHTKIGDFLMINMSTTIGHHVTIGNGVFMSSGVNVGANLTVRNRVYIGIGATIMSSIDELGEESLVGAGSVIIRNVAAKTTVVGNPGRVISEKSW